MLGYPRTPFLKTWETMAFALSPSRELLSSVPCGMCQERVLTNEREPKGVVLHPALVKTQAASLCLDKNCAIRRDRWVHKESVTMSGSWKAKTFSFFPLTAKQPQRSLRARPRWLPLANPTFNRENLWQIGLPSNLAQCSPTEICYFLLRLLLQEPRGFNGFQ